MIFEGINDVKTLIKRSELAERTVVDVKLSVRKVAKEIITAREEREGTQSVRVKSSAQRNVETSGRKNINTLTGNQQNNLRGRFYVTRNRTR